MMPMIKKRLRNVESSNTADVLRMNEGKTLPFMVIFVILVMRRSILQEARVKAVNRIRKFFS